MDGKIFCDRCGAEMKINQRCCIKCGRINYKNADNASMLKYADNNSNDSYVVGAGSKLSTDIGKNFSLTKNIGDRRSCIIFNIGLLLFVIIFSFFFIYLETYSIQKTLTSFWFVLIVVISSFTIFESISFQFIFMKANKPWWSVLIPFYNLYNHFEISMKSGILFLISLIPGIGLIFYFVSLYKLADKFNCSGVFCVLFSYVSIPMMAFNSATRYENTYYIQNTDVQIDINNSIVKEYKSNKILLRIFLILIGISIFALGYFHYDRLINIYYETKTFVFNMFK